METEFFYYGHLDYYVHQLDFDGAGRQGRKQGVVEVEFDTCLELDRQMLLIHERLAYITITMRIMDCINIISICRASRICLTVRI